MSELPTTEEQLPPMRSKRPRFGVMAASNNEERIYVDDDDFGYDALIKISGDFGTLAEKMRYAEAVAAALNAAENTIPVAPQDDVTTATTEKTK